MVAHAHMHKRFPQAVKVKAYVRTHDATCDSQACVAVGALMKAMRTNLDDTPQTSGE